MSHPNPTHEKENEYPEDGELHFEAVTPAEHFGKIKELVKTLEVQLKDLQDALDDLKV